MSAVDATQHLSPRLRQTLEGLAAGAGEKEIANRLRLSKHTVHGYIKALHTLYGASSRGELLARAVYADRGGVRPAATAPEASVPRAAMDFVTITATLEPGCTLAIDAAARRISA